MARLRTGKPLGTLERVEEAEQYALDHAERVLVDTMRSRWVIGDAAEAAAQLRAMAAKFGVDEVMVSPNAGARMDEPAHRTTARERTLELLAKELL